MEIPLLISMAMASTSVSNRRDAKPARASLSTDEIEEHAFVVVLQVGQVVGEVGEVVAGADLHVVADVAIDRGQGSAAPLTDIREIEHSHFSQPIPALEQPPVHANHRELRGVVEELRLRPLARNALAKRGKESRGIHTDLHARIEVTNLTRAVERDQVNIDYLFAAPIALLTFGAPTSPGH